MKEKYLLPALSVLILSRVPLLTSGYGSEGDAWRIAQTSLRIWHDGEYRVSRMFGYPVYEFLNAPIIALGGAFASNLATLLIFIVSLYCLHRILEIWSVPVPGALLLTFAFFPLLWKNSAVTMDYIWGLAGILSATWMVLRRQFVLAGVLLGLAAGTRISQLAYLLPLFLLCPNEDRKGRLMLATSAFATTFVCYIPFILSSTASDIGSIQFIASKVWGSSLLTTIGAYSYRVVFSVGILAFAAVSGIVFLQRKRLAGLMANRAFLFSLSCVFLTLFLFALWPPKREYLIPMVPFLLIAVFFLGQGRQIAGAVVCFLAYSFFGIDVIDHKTGSPEVRIALVQGLVVKEYTDRLEFKDWRERVSASDVPDSSVVMTGCGPIFGLENPLVTPSPDLAELLRQDCYRTVGKRTVYFVYSLNYPQLMEMRKRGFTAYYTDNAKAYLESFVGYRLDEEDVLELKTTRS